MLFIHDRACSYGAVVFVQAADTEQLVQLLKATETLACGYQTAGVAIETVADAGTEAA